MQDSKQVVINSYICIQILKIYASFFFFFLSKSRTFTNYKVFCGKINA